MTGEHSEKEMKAEFIADISKAVKMALKKDPVFKAVMHFLSETTGK